MSNNPLFAALGFTSIDEAAYRLLLRTSPLPILEMADSLGISKADTQQTVDSLTEWGLVRVVTGTNDIAALDPRHTLVPLARQRQQALDGVGSVADEFAAHLSAHRVGTTAHDFIQILEGQDEITGRLVAMFTGATGSAVSLVAPPYFSDLNLELQRAESSMIDRGITMRAVYDTSFVRDSAHLSSFREGVLGGEQARLLEGMKTKLIMVDGSSALLPIESSPDDRRPRAVSVTRSSITDALALLFEHMWSRAADVPRIDSGQIRRRGDLRDNTIVEMMLQGLSDGTIADALDTSERTIRRRINAILLRHDVTTRFELGYVLGGLDSRT